MHQDFRTGRGIRHNVSFRDAHDRVPARELVEQVQCFPTANQLRAIAHQDADEGRAVAGAFVVHGFESPARLAGEAGEPRADALNTSYGVVARLHNRAPFEVVVRVLNRAAHRICEVAAYLTGP